MKEVTAMKKAKIIIPALAMSAAAVFFAGCGSETSSSKSANYADGTYEGKSSVFTNDDGSTDGNGYGVVKITIQDGAITDCVYDTYETDGTLKGEDYGKEGGQIANRDYYNKAQKAIAACNEYATQLVSNGSLDGIDAISGATINYNSFTEAVSNALEQAKQ